jgi:hypothetical protein
MRSDVSNLLVICQVERTWIPPKPCIIHVDGTIEEPCRLCGVSSPPFSGCLLELIGCLEKVIFRLWILSLNLSKSLLAAISSSYLRFGSESWLQEVFPLGRHFDGDDGEGDGDGVAVGSFATLGVVASDLSQEPVVEVKSIINLLLLPSISVVKASPDPRKGRTDIAMSEGPAGINS